MINPSALFIRRPVATTLLALAIALSGLLAVFRLPVTPLPNAAFPVIVVQASMAGASPQTMAATVAAPLERRLGAIADVNELTSVNSLSSTFIVIQFGLSRGINGAARDVQAAIQAARADLPTTLRSNPIYRQYNPAAAPLAVLSLTSETLTTSQLYDAASSVVQQQLSQIRGVGQVTVGGGALPAVRVELEPSKLNSYGIGLEDVRASVSAANANSAKGHIDEQERRYEVLSNDQISSGAAYRDLVIAYRQNAPVMLRDVAQVVDSTENLRNAGIFNDKPAVLVIVYPQPGSNIVQTADQIRAALPSIQGALPGSVKMDFAIDLSQSVRASVGETGRALFIAVILVVGVVFIFFRSPRSALIPAVALPLSIIGTFGPMYLLGFSIDNLSLMALTIGTGFVVDDAVVVLENVMRHVEAGMTPREAALKGSGEVAFTVISMTLSLIAVFLPILLMPGLVGLLFHEFAATLSIAILISLVVSLTVTPAMCAYLLPRVVVKKPKTRIFDRIFERFRSIYSLSLSAVLRRSLFVVLILIALLVANVLLLRFLKSTLLPEEDNNILLGQVIADQSTSFAVMKQKLTQVQSLAEQDPAVQSVAGFTGGSNTAQVFVVLKPPEERHVTAQEVVNRLRPKLDTVPGARLYLQVQQDLPVGGRQSTGEYQYTLTADDVDQLYRWTPKFVADLSKYRKQILDVNSDLQQNGLQLTVHLQRATAKRFGFEPNQLDSALYDAVGQRTVSTIYNARNQYSVVMEAAQQYAQFPQQLMQLYLSTAAGNVSGTEQTQMRNNTVSGGTSGSVSSQASLETASTNLLNSSPVANTTTNSIANSTGGVSSGSADSTNSETMVPLAAFTKLSIVRSATQVNHQGTQVAVTISFNLPPGGTLSGAVDAIAKAGAAIGLPASIHGEFAGVAKVYSQSMDSIPLLLFGALGVVYLVLGVLYENTVHPITILSTLPSAFIGATLALLVFDTPFSLIALIGIILLIGIVKKNGIMMVDVAIELQRQKGLSAERAIHDAAIVRLRPILMTTFAAMLGALPLAAGIGQGAALRQPLGVVVIGGLLFSQVFTLYSTPVIYLYMDRMRARLAVWSLKLPWNRPPKSETA